MDACVDIYQRTKIDSLGMNFVTGLVSAGKASDVQGTMDSLKVKETSSFELAYTAACSLIERNKHKDAEQLLLSARRTWLTLEKPLNLIPTLSREIWQMNLHLQYR